MLAMLLLGRVVGAASTPVDDAVRVIATAPAIRLLLLLSGCTIRN